MTQIRLESLRKFFGAVEVIKGVNLEIVTGEFMVFVGPSGCGKSTLLRMIAGLEEVTSGGLFFDGNAVNALPPSKRGIAMVFQSYALYPHMSVYQNMSFGLQLAKRGKAEIDRRVRETADLLQITPYLDKLPRVLSGGQRQRVAIGRAIVRDPGVFLFDEPLSNLDATLRVAMRLEIAKLKHRMTKTTMIYVTHDQVEAMTLADRVCVLRDRMVEQVGTPAELYHRPRSLFVATFIGSPKMNILNGRFASDYGAHTIGIRPEHLMISTAPAQWSGQVIMRENLGAETYLYVNIGAPEPLIVRAEALVPHDGDGNGCGRKADAIRDDIRASSVERDQIYIALKHEDYLYRFDKDGLLMETKQTPPRNMQ